MLDTILKSHRGELVEAITRRSELGEGEAESLLPAAFDAIGTALKSGQIDPSNLFGGGREAVGQLLGSLNVSEIADDAGLDEDRARGGLASLLPVLMSLLQNETGGAQDLLAALGGSGGAGGRAGLIGALGGVAGKLFGR